MPCTAGLRTLALVAGLLMVLSVAIAADDQPAGAAGPPFVKVNGTAVATSFGAPMLIDGTIMLQVDDLFAAIGGQVKPDPAGRLLVVERAGVTIRMTVDALDFTVGDEKRQFYIPPMKVRKVVYVDVNTLVAELGGQLAWEPATLTANLIVEVPGSEARVVVGTLVQIIRGDVPLFMVRQAAGEQPAAFPGAQGMKVYRLDAQGAPVAATLDQVKAGDSVELGLNAEGKVVRCLTADIVASGVLESIGGGEVVLQDGARFQISPDVKASTADGNKYEVVYLRKGDKVSLTLNPADRTVASIVVDLTGVGVRTEDSTPRIIVLSTSARKPLKEGDRLWVVLRGTPGGKATLDIGDAKRGIEMAESEPGLYGLRYTVRAGDNAISVPLFGHLEVKGKQAEVAVGNTTVTLDTTPPAFIGISPANLANVDNASPTILATYADANGSGVDTAAVKLTLDGTDVTANAAVTADSASYQAADLAAGNHTVAVEIADRAGNAAKLDSAFTLRVTAANLIKSVKHDATAALMTGGTLTVTMEVTQKGKEAYFTIGDRAERIAMQPIAVANTYRGQYQVKATDTATGVAIKGFLVANDDRVHSMAATTTVDFNTRPQGLTVTAPAENGRVSSSKIAVEGLAPPGAKVRVVISYELFGKHTLDSDTATADANGAWKTRELDLQRNLAAMLVSEYTLTAELLGDNERVTDTKQFRIKSAGG